MRMLIVLLGMLVLASSATAQRAGPAPCRDDIREFCRNHEPGHGAVKRCLQEHSGAVSSSCRASLQERSDHPHRHEEQPRNAR